MKSRRHRAIDKSLKEIPMMGFNHKRNVKKKLSKVFKVHSREFYDSMMVYWAKGIY